jgi:acetylornithine deacetylase
MNAPTRWTEPDGEGQTWGGETDGSIPPEEIIMNELERSILDTVDRQSDEILQFLSDFVQIPSLTGEEGQAQDFMKNALSGLGCELDIWEPDLEELKRHPECQQVTASYRDRPVVVGTFKGTGGGRSLILNGHVDVVPLEPIESWHHGGP